ncbi:hypothetical protein [Bradyrhizobium murdochi]|uniref:hypothetical protein n=1 Tax=Bradyrhizobium murdochi TaxID=1038859 RepID=UPI0004888A4F|nr:hypothetical protein [Bradyrhizobium murdochi]
MPKPFLKGIDPKNIFMHARGFHLADAVIGNFNIDENPEMGAELVQPAMVLSAFNSELFLKCIICIETGDVPTGHHLVYLFNLVSPKTRSRIEHIWNTEVVPLREPMWRTIETKLPAIELPIKRDLPSALMAANKAFEEIRYSYESKNKKSRFYVSDLPRVLGRIILQLKPEWEHLRRSVKEISRPDQKS